MNTTLSRSNHSSLRKFAMGGLLTIVMIGGFAQNARADRDDHWDRHDGYEDRPHEMLHHRGYDHDHDHWREGRWLRGDHGGRRGWWWVADGRWYYYEHPVYPYPVDPYAPRVVYAPPVVVSPPPEPPSGINLIVPLNIR